MYSKKQLLQIDDFHDYQETAIFKQLYHDNSMLWIGMGLGKTAITLTTVAQRKRLKLVKKVIIFGPLRVVHSVWEQEAKKWQHLKNLKFQIIHGTERHRERQLMVDADVYLINYEMMSWFTSFIHRVYLSKNFELPWQMVVYDEVTRMKDATTIRLGGGMKKVKEKFVSVKGWNSVLDKFKYKTGLTGTPAPNGYGDLHGQYLAIDSGKRLGRRITHFRNAFMTPNFNGYGFRVTPLGKREIEKRIQDITVRMNSEDYISLPGSIINDIVVELPPKVKIQYKSLENDFFTKLDGGSEIEVFNAASLSNKCLQFSNGSPYLEPGGLEWYPLHDAKLKALEEVLEEASGHSVLVAYTFKSDAERIMSTFKRFNPINLTAVKASKLARAIKAIIAGKYQLIVGHPASMSHGIDGLQEIVHIAVWFGIPWNLEHYQQFMGRYIRQGQKNTTVTHRIICNDTMDEVVLDSLKMKDSDQENLKKSIRKYRDK